MMKHDTESGRPPAERRPTERGDCKEFIDGIDMQTLVHELRIHQTELEMQNEEVRVAHAATENVSRKYTDLFDFAPVAYFLWDEWGKIQELNLAGATLLGLNRIKAINMRFGQFVEQEDHPKFADFCRLAIQADIKQTCQVKLLIGEQRVHVLIEAVAASDHEGKITRCRAAVIDITAQKRLDEALREQAVLHDILDTVGEGVFLLDLEGIILACNATAASRFGKTENAMVGRSMFEVLPAKIAKSRMSYMQKAAKSGTSVQFEDMREGIQFEHRVYPVPDASRKGIQLAIISRDITERKEAEELLQSKEVFHRDILNNLASHISVLDRQGTIIAVNAAWDRFAQENGNGHADRLGVGVNYLDACRNASGDLHEEARAALKGIEAVLQGYQPDFSSEYSCHSPDAYRWFVMKVTALSHQTGGVVVSHMDITDRKQAEQERMETERHLLHAQRLESLGVLAGGIAHDFNNILAGIMGHADLARLRLPESAPALEDIEEIRLVVERAADLTRQMLAYTGKGKFSVAPVSLSQVVEDNKKMLAMLVSKKATMIYHLASDLPVIQADATQIHQVVLNLAINASEALGANSGEIEISTDTLQYGAADYTVDRGGIDLQEGLYVRLRIADTGCGMDKQTQARIFDPFFTTKFTGRGLGLATVHGIVRGHKGGMRVSSKTGEGTFFEVLFPAIDATQNFSAGESISSESWRGRGTVLVVDDEKLIRDLASRMIEHVGFGVLTARDGEEAIRIYELHKKDVTCVLLDLTMPKMNGEETFRELRRISPDIPVILSSGYSPIGVAERLTPLGLAGFLQKPYQFDKMVAVLREATSRGNAKSNCPSSPIQPVVGITPLFKTGKFATGQHLPTVLVVDDDETIRKSTRVILKHAGFSTLAAHDGESAIHIFQEHQNQIVCIFLDLNLPKMSGKVVFREIRRISSKVRVVVTSGYPTELLEEQFAGGDVFGFVCKPEPLDVVIAKLHEALVDADRRV
ncbi:MAG: response regulator [Planctomycetota bacterium]